MADRVDRWVARLIESWGVPGMAVVVVKDGKVIVARGYGVRKLGGKRVDAETIFPLGSLTKSFTTAALAMLVDAGKLRWDDPVRQHLPDFRVADPYFTAHLTVRDLLHHKTGFGEHFDDPLWMTESLVDPRSTQPVKTWPVIRAGLARVKPRHSFRGRWGYGNVTYELAGRILARLAGKRWAEFVRERLLAPLRMTRTVTRYTQLPQMTNRAWGHMLDAEGRLAPFTIRHDHPLPAAGALSASASDIGRYLLFHLGDGSVDGRRLISRAQLAALHRPQAVMYNPGWEKRFGARFHAYGLGWFIHDYRGRKLVRHGGLGAGFASMITLAPEVGLGIAILTNHDGHAAHATLTFHILDAYLGGARRPWTKLFLRFKHRVPKRQPVARQPAELRPYVGTYRTKRGFTRRVFLRDGKLYMAPRPPPGAGPPILDARLFPLGGERFFVRTADGLITFSRGASGAVTGFTEVWAGRLRLRYDRVPK